VTTHPLQRLTSSITGLVVSGLDSSGRHVGQDRLNKRLESAQLLLGHALDNPKVISIPAQISQLDQAGYPVVGRSWIVFALVDASPDQFLELRISARKLGRLWGRSVGLMGPDGYTEVQI
jgi:hypothetical protein